MNKRNGSGHLATYPSQPVQRPPESGVPRTLFHQAEGLIQESELDQALVVLQALLVAEPCHVEAWYKQGNALKDLNRLREALASYERAIELKPRHTAAHCNRGVVLQALGRPEEALHEFRQAIDIEPSDSIAHYNKGVSEQILKQTAAAFSSYSRALELNPHYAESYLSRALLHQESGSWHEALRDYEHALEFRPDLAMAHFHRGNLLVHLKHWDDALASFHLAVASDPRHALAHLQRGNVLCELRQWDAAVGAYDRVIALEPEHADAHFNRAVVLGLLKRFPEALEGLERAISLRPDFVAAQYNRALLLLQTGKFGAGFESYEWRWRNRGTGFDPVTYHGAVPQWTGIESLEGRRILIFSEQGLGDTVQFSRYLKLLAGLGADVVFEVQPPLAGLLANFAGAKTVIARGDPVPPCDFKCALMSLPFAFKTTVDSIPAERRYLHADAGIVAGWQARLGPRTRPRIGLVWSGNRQYPDDRRRSIPLATLIEPLPRDFEYFCLQTDIRAQDLATLDANPFIANPAADLVGTAALCECMDLVISSCTSIAHLAGALGRPLWVLLAYNADWRWLEDREDSPWYPTARLYRQTLSGDWGGVVGRVAADLTSTISTGVSR